MSIKIDKKICNGCPGIKEPFCIRICPGDLLKIGKDNKCTNIEVRDCWDCTACLKACPRQAISMYLPASIGGRGALLKARVFKDKISWTCISPDGNENTIEVEAEKII